MGGEMSTELSTKLRQSCTPPEQAMWNIPSPMRGGVRGGGGQMLCLTAKCHAWPVFLAKMDSRLRGNDAENAAQIVPQPPSSPGLTRGSSRPHRLRRGGVVCGAW